MDKEKQKIFNKLWKVDTIKALLRLADKKTKVTRTETRSLERDLAFIKYGFEEGLNQIRVSLNEKN